jgi:hypothetical protein
MSLKAFHIFFISVSILLTLGFGVWGVTSFENTGNSGHLYLAIGSFVAMVLLAVYFRWFLRKLKNESYL